MAGTHQLLAGALAARLGRDGCPELAKELIVLPDGEPGINQRVHDRAPVLSQPRDIRGQSRAVRQVRQRRIAPQRQRLHEGGGGSGCIADVELRLALRGQVAELVGIQFSRPDVHDVAALLPEDWRAAARRPDRLQPRSRPGSCAGG